MQREGGLEVTESDGERYITATEARDDFSDFINRVAYGKERFIVRRRRKEFAAVIPMEEYRFLQRAIEAELDRQGPGGPRVSRAMLGAPHHSRR